MAEPVRPLQISSALHKRGLIARMGKCRRSLACPTKSLLRYLGWRNLAQWRSMIGGASGSRAFDPREPTAHSGQRRTADMSNLFSSLDLSARAYPRLLSRFRSNLFSCLDLSARAYPRLLSRVSSNLFSRQLSAGLSTQGESAVSSFLLAATGVPWSLHGQRSTVK